MTATYTIKVPTSWAHVDSACVRRWLSDGLMSSGLGAVGADPGAGDRVLRLSLPANRVEAFAQALGELPAVALRRLIATRLGIPLVSQELWLGYGSWLPVTNTDPPALPQRESEPVGPWIDLLTTGLFLAVLALIAWLLFFRNKGAVPTAIQLPVPQSLVSGWSPLP